MFTGSVFVFGSFMISSADWLTFDFTVSVCRSSFFPHKTSENSFFLLPLGGAETAVPQLVNPVLLVTYGAASLAEGVDFHFSEVSLNCLTSFRVLLFSCFL
jgi:hypothetical protein